MKFMFSQKKGISRKNRSPLTMSETQRFLVLSILIGVFAGLLVVCFHITMEFISWYSLGTLAEMTHTGTLLSPALGATISAFLVFFVFKKAHGSGVTQTKAAYYIYDGYVPFSTVIGKFLACSISIGSGNSLGPEDPTIQMGAGIASLLGRCFRLGRESMRLIAPVGAAAGLAAVFNAPITGVLFVMEEIIAGWHAGVLGSIILSSTAAVVVVRWFLGNAPLFVVPQFQLRNPLELIVYALVGVFTGLLSVAFVEAVGSLRHLQERFPSWTRYLLPGAAGLLVGVAGIWYPEIMGAGYDAIDSALHNRFSWSALLIIGLLKIVATILCSSARTPGGMFAPTLFAGAMIGGALGGISQHLQLFPTSATDAYVLVGMGTFFAAVFRAPMTSIFMVFEVSANYVIILPVLIANTTAYMIARKLQRVPYFEMHAKEEGLDLPSGEAEREINRLQVEDAMQPPHAVFGPRTPVRTALELMRRDSARFRLVKIDYGEWSWVELEELEQAMHEGRGDARLADVIKRGPVPRLYPDYALDSALPMMRGNRVLPVASRANQNQLIGTLTLADIHHAFGIDAQDLLHE